MSTTLLFIRLIESLIALLNVLDMYSRSTDSLLYMPSDRHSSDTGSKSRINLCIIKSQIKATATKYHQEHNSPFSSNPTPFQFPSHLLIPLQPRHLSILQTLHQPPRPHIPLVPNPQIPAAQQNRHPTRQRTRIIHGGIIKRLRKRETVDWDPNNHVRARQTSYGIKYRVGHCKRALDYAFAAGEDVRDEEGEVGEGAEYAKRADEGVEGGAAADVDAA